MTRPDNYILIGHKAYPTNDIHVWWQWFERIDRTVAKTTVGKTLISTVFLGIDHNFDDGPPHIFETMVFGAEELTWRYSTWDEAVIGHDRAVQLVKKGAKP